MEHKVLRPFADDALDALAEGAIDYRNKTRAALKRLKDYKRIRKTSFAYMPTWEEPGLQDDLQQAFARYLRFHKGYYALQRVKKVA